MCVLVSQLLCPPLVAGWAVAPLQSKNAQLLEGRADTALLPCKMGSSILPRNIFFGSELLWFTTVEEHLRPFPG